MYGIHKSGAVGVLIAAAVGAVVSMTGSASTPAQWPKVQGAVAISYWQGSDTSTQGALACCNSLDIWKNPGA